MKSYKIRHIISLVALTCFLILAVGSDDSGSSTTSSKSSPSYKYYCDECGDGFSGKPYQCIFYNCVKANTVSSALDKFCSCYCGVRHMARDGFDYNCN